MPSAVTHLAGVGVVLSGMALAGLAVAIVALRHGPRDFSAAAAWPR